MSEKCVEAIQSCKKRNGRVIAVGTTVTRTLESVFQQKSRWYQWWGKQISLYERGFEFSVIDGLITNFSSSKVLLLMLVSAISGRERILQIYKQAVEKNIAFSLTGMRCCFCHNFKIDQENRQHRSIFTQNRLHFIVIFGDYEFTVFNINVIKKLDKLVLVYYKPHMAL